ncbi:MAG TPA: flagellar motor protein [Terriglobales bacterium]|nr:flagellar motor protein [Terriglobales bacterium]
MDKASVSGVLLGLAGIIGGLLLEGGTVSQILQPTAAMIVFGGTAGAVLVQFPLPIVMTAVGRLAGIFSEPRTGLEAAIDRLVGYANIARRRGIVSLDAELPNVEDPFMRKVLTLAVDGTEPQELRKIAELELDNLLEREERYPLVFESAGGFSPTVGIIGAVLGLIQVMQHLDKIDEVGRGIAVAFVATIYGVGAANLLFLPAAGKLRLRLREQQAQREMVLEGVISILGGMNPRMLRNSLRSFLGESKVELEDNVKANAAGA